MLRIGTIVMGAAEVRRAVSFWCQALNYVPRYEVADDWAVLVPADGRAGPGLSLARSETPAQDHPGCIRICTPATPTIRPPRWSA